MTQPKEESKSKLMHVMHIDCFKAFNAEMAEESYRGRVVLGLAWIDRLIQIKLMNEYAFGSAKVRKELFSPHGPFGEISGKISAAYCAGWLDEDVYHDLKIIQKLRNKFAHDIEVDPLEDGDMRQRVESFQVPHRKFSDWGKLRVVATESDVIFYTGTRPEKAIADLSIPGSFTFGQAISTIVAVLITNLGIVFRTDEEGEGVVVTLPEWMIQEAAGQ